MSAAPLALEAPPPSRALRRDWDALANELDENGAAVLPALLTPSECIALSGRYADASAFRSRVVMERHGFGRGEYQYFAYPLPSLVQELRSALYPPLARIANRWQELLGFTTRFPDDLEPFLERCHDAGQPRPTPLLLRYRSGDFNCLHQDLYGEHVFPLQLTVLLSAPGRDFRGGEFVLTEQRARAQSRVHVVPLTQGDAVLFPVRHRPCRGRRGFYRVNVRHGVSVIRDGARCTLGVVFHDAA